MEQCGAEIWESSIFHTPLGVTWSSANLIRAIWEAVFIFVALSHVRMVRINAQLLCPLQKKSSKIPLEALKMGSIGMEE